MGTDFRAHKGVVIVFNRRETTNLPVVEQIQIPHQSALAIAAKFLDQSIILRIARSASHPSATMGYRPPTTILLFLAVSQNFSQKDLERESHVRNSRGQPPDENSDISPVRMWSARKGDQGHGTSLKDAKLMILPLSKNSSPKRSPPRPSRKYLRLTASSSESRGRLPSLS